MLPAPATPRRRPPGPTTTTNPCASCVYRCQRTVRAPSQPTRGTSRTEVYTSKIMASPLSVGLGPVRQLRQALDAVTGERRGSTHSPAGHTKRHHRGIEQNRHSGRPVSRNRRCGVVGWRGQSSRQQWLLTTAKGKKREQGQGQSRKTDKCTTRARAQPRPLGPWGPPAAVNAQGFIW